MLKKRAATDYSTSTAEQSLDDVPTLRQAPLDYAPKAEASNSGTLSEEYGLEKVSLHEQHPVHEATSSANTGAPTTGHPAEPTAAQKGPPNLSTG